MEAEIIPAEKRGTLAQKSDTTVVRGTVEFGTYPIYSWPELFKTENSNKIINDENLRKVMYEFGKNELQKKLQAGEVSGVFELKINHVTGPKSCPYDPTIIEIDYEKWHEVEVSRPIGFKP